MENMDKNMDTIIELQGITKVFEDGFKAVDDFNLTVKRGEFVTFLGPSGCGKTTTLRMIAGFEMPTKGRYPAERKIHHRTSSLQEADKYRLPAICPFSSHECP